MVYRRTPEAVTAAADITSSIEGSHVAPLLKSESSMMSRSKILQNRVTALLA